MSQRFVKGDKVKYLVGYAFSTGERVATVARTEDYPNWQKVWVDDGGWMENSEIELVKSATEEVANMIDRLNSLYKEKQEELDKIKEELGNIKVAIKTLEKLEGENK